MLTIQNIDKIIDCEVRSDKHLWHVWGIRDIDTDAARLVPLVYEISVGRKVSIFENEILQIHLYRECGDLGGYRIKMCGALQPTTKIVIRRDEIKKIENLLTAIQTLLIQYGK